MPKLFSNPFYSNGIIIVFTTRKKMIGATNTEREERVIVAPRAINKSPR
jgi:hypothetical protein